MTTKSQLRKAAIMALKSNAHRLNNFVHQPYMYDLAWYGYYTLGALCAPLLVLGLAAMFIYDVLSGRFFIERHIDAEGRVVVVSGCDSGFGLEIAKKMASQGFKVYAGCLTEAGIKQLQGVSELLIPVQLNVMKQDHIDAVMQMIDHDNAEGLYCVINNAGVGIGGPLDWVDMDHYDLVMGVNFFGMVRMCKSALPLLKKSAREGRGARIVNVTSIAGLFGTLVFMSAYAASKHAAEAFSRSLRAELSAFGIDVSIVNPTFHATAMADSSAQFKQLFNSLPPHKQLEYGNDYLDQLLRIAHEGQTWKWDVSNVTRMLYHAVAGVKPRDQYVVGIDGSYVIAPLTVLPARIQHAFISALGQWHKLVPDAASKYIISSPKHHV